MTRKALIERIHNELVGKKGECLIGLYGGFGMVLGTTLSDYYDANIPSTSLDPTPAVLGMPGNLAFGIATFVLLMIALCSTQKSSSKLDLRPISVFTIVFSIGTVYVLIRRNPSVLAWIGIFGVLISLIAALHFYAPVDSALVTKIDRTKSNRTRGQLIGFLKMKHGDHVKYMDIAILGTVALLTIAVAGLASFPESERMHGFIFSIVYGLWFAYNFIGLIVGVICQLLQKLTEINKTIVSILIRMD